MGILTGLNPERVFYHFEEIAKIPHGSGNEKALSDYIFSFAKGLGLEAVQDEAHNVIVRLPASRGYENSPAVIFQGHIDMVCEKNNDTDFDFLNDGIKLEIDGDYIRAKGTTLGADNGIAAAYAMALMEKPDFGHPEVEFVFTSAEEVGMLGAAALDASLLRGRIFLNCDAEEEGVFFSSCAGGVRAQIKLDCGKTEVPVGFLPYEINLTGLHGGHSGMDIGKERGNSNRIMGRILRALSNEFSIYLGEISGGSKENAIPREARALVFMSENPENAIARLEKVLSAEYKVSDPGLKLSVKLSEGSSAEVFTKDGLQKILTALLLAPCGVLSMSLDIPGLVESSNNIGVISSEGHYVNVRYAVRSSVGSRKVLTVEQIKLIAELTGGEFSSQGDYPAWEYDAGSKIRKIFTERYEALTGKKAEIAAIHAGLECGLFAEKLPGLDMIAFGPNLFDVHTPNERISISSAARIWDFIVNALESMK